MRTTLKHLTLSLCLLAAVTAAETVNAQTDTQTRIVNGTAIDISDAPSTVALLNNSLLAQTGSYAQAQFCGGTVIGAHWVLSAAHCFLDRDNVQTAPDAVSALIGSTDLQQTVNQPVSISRITVHQSYDPVSHNNDIALLELSYDAGAPAAPLNTQPIQLNDEALIAGWGAFNEGSDVEQQVFPNVLQGAIVKMIPGDQCASMFSTYGGRVNNNMLCAGVPDGGVDTCQGDSGGPLYRFDASGSGSLQLVGVTSWGDGCGRANAPGVYTRVSAFTNWINSHMGSGGTQPGMDITQPQPPQIINDEPDINEEPIRDTSAEADPFASFGAGASGLFTLPLLGLTLWLRRFRREAKPGRYLAALGVSAISVLALAFWVQKSSAHTLEAVDISLAQQPIGHSRDEVIDQAARLWQEQPVCTVIRTGYGVSRRAYFLETCTFATTIDTTICNATPISIEYRFLEKSLVQVGFEFNEMADPAGYRDCIHQQIEHNVTTNAAPVINIDEQYRTTVSDAVAVQQIRQMKSAF